MSDAARDFVAVLDRFVGAHVDARQIDAQARIPADVLGALADLGVFGACLPEEHGGGGLDLAGACAVVEALARHDRSVATTVGLHLGLGTRGLVAFGTEAQRARWLPGLARGERLAAFATTEPNAGSDLARLETRLHAEAGRRRLDGHKVYVTNGGLAHVFTVTAATTGEGAHPGGRALVVLAKDDDGLTTGPEEHKLGLRGSSTTTLRLEAIDVAPDRILGDPGCGSEQLAHVLAWGRTVMAAGCIGTARAALDKAIDHVRLRRQFGRALAAQPVVRAQVADMAATLHAMRALVDAAAASVGAVARPSADSERLSLSAKILCSEGSGALCDMALQLHGGSGYIEDTGVPLLMRDARITRIFEGANDVLATRLGQLELTSPKTPGRADDEASPELALIDTLVGDLVKEARGRGLAALRDAVLAHRLGRLVALREAAHATAAATPADRPGPVADLSRHALARLAHMCMHVHALRALASTERIGEALLDDRAQP
ncbi:MAG: acyl-CoA dehydrogenase family protein [Deltaproteobacteria bacterium]|nr:acyl-CoA dehydrogenase family protein [Deltaproteobacteria bacterium]